MPSWAKLVLRTVAVLDAVLAALGTYWLLLSVDRFFVRYRPHFEAPNFGIAFAVMASINLVFLGFFFGQLCD
jgi:hypothetical protein